MDAVVLRFTTSFFDVTKERPNDINPIFGESLLRWLREKLKDRYTITEPATEDWGWYVEIDWNGRHYMLGASASDEEDGEREWALQVVKHRSFKEGLLGREKMTANDACVAEIRKLLDAEKAFKDVSVD